jgi:hypothetical protein
MQPESFRKQKQMDHSQFSTELLLLRAARQRKQAVAVK